jgi:hypothetical protein
MNINVINTIKSLFQDKKVERPSMRELNAFSLASDAYGALYEAIEPYTIRANHRLAILLKDPRASRNAEVVNSRPDETNKKEIAFDFVPADFEPYTEAYLDAHTASIDNLTTAFDAFVAAFAALNPADRIYNSAVAVYGVTCSTYTLAATGYSNAVECAIMNTMQGDIQATKDKFQVLLLETRATNATVTEADSAKAKATAFKTESEKNEIKINSLKLKARAAEAKAKLILLKAKTTEAQVKQDTQNES